jgi:murein DD-endopeptidase MepM/ murein hydrolase activator NlpD
MTALVYRTIFFSFTFKDVLKIVFFVSFFILSLPVLAILVVVNTGTAVVSDTLVSTSTNTGIIQIRNPSTGEISTTISGDKYAPVRGVVTLEFGKSHLPYQVLHTGLDIANARGVEGDPIVAFMDGNVSYVGELNWGYGKHIIIDHGNNISTLYAHLSRIDVTVGQKIAGGEVIGLMGNTGWSTGPHLHFEVRVYGIPVNPNNFI